MFSVATSCGDSIIKLQYPRRCAIDSILSIPLVSRCQPARKEISTVRFCSCEKEKDLIIYGDSSSLSIVRPDGKLYMKLLENDVLACETSPDTKYIACGTRDGNVSVVDWTRRKMIYRSEAQKNACTAVAYTVSREFKYVASGHSNGDIVFHNVSTNRLCQRVRAPGSTQAVRGLGYGRGALMAACSDEGRVTLWDVNAYKHVSDMNVFDAPAHGVQFHPTRSQFAACSLDKRFSVFDAKTSKSVHKITTSHPLSCMSHSPNGSSLVFGTTDGFVLVYDFRSLSSPVGIAELNGRVTSIDIRESHTSTSSFVAPQKRVVSTSNSTKRAGSTVVISPVRKARRLSGETRSSRSPNSIERFKNSSSHDRSISDEMHLNNTGLFTPNSSFGKGSLNLSTESFPYTAATSSSDGVAGSTFARLSADLDQENRPTENIQRPTETQTSSKDHRDFDKRLLDISTTSSITFRANRTSRGSLDPVEQHRQSRGSMDFRRLSENPAQTSSLNSAEKKPNSEPHEFIRPSQPSRTVDRRLEPASNSRNNHVSGRQITPSQSTPNATNVRHSKHTSETVNGRSDICPKSLNNTGFPRKTLNRHSMPNTNQDNRQEFTPVYDNGSVDASSTQQRYNAMSVPSQSSSNDSTIRSQNTGHNPSTGVSSKQPPSVHPSNSIISQHRTTNSSNPEKTSKSEVSSSHSSSNKIINAISSDSSQQSTSSAGPIDRNWQAKLFESVVKSRLDAIKDQLQTSVRNVHMDLLRQSFDIKEDLASLRTELREHTSGVVEENRRLREELDRIKKV
eukprot:271543_1